MNEKIIIGLVSAIFTLIFKFILDRRVLAIRRNNQRVLLLNFIDDIIIKYCNINLKEFDKIIIKFDTLINEPIIESPMLNKNIFDYFDKNDLIKILSFDPEIKFTDLYHYMYEIEFLKENSPSKIHSNFINYANNHIKKSLEEKNKDFNKENILTHFSECSNCKEKKETFISNIYIQKKHYENLKNDFEKIKISLMKKNAFRWKCKFFFK